MSTFRQQHNLSSGEESAGGESDGEDNLTNRILLNNNRPKAVAKRRISRAKIDESKKEQIDVNEEELDKKEVPNAGKLWAETVVMQTLEEEISLTSSTAKLIKDRGVESYVCKGKLDLTNRKRHRQDDISDSIWDDQQMGGKEKEKPEEANPLNEEKPADNEELINEEAKTDPVVDLWDGVDTGAVELPIERERQRNNKQQWRNSRGGGWNSANQFKRFKQDQQSTGERIVGGGWRWGRGGGGKWLQQRGGGRGGGGNAAQQKKMLPPEKFVPRRLIAADYDQQKLFNTDLDPEILSEEELVKALVELLGEKEPAIIQKAVEFTGKQLAVEIFKECQEVEKCGGMLTKKRDRRKAPGGVFLELFNKREEISEEQKKAMYQLGSELIRKSGCHPKWWDKRERKKMAKTMMELDNTADEILPPDLDNEDLPASSELIKPNIGEDKEVTSTEIVTEQSLTLKNIANGSK